MSNSNFDIKSGDTLHSFKNFEKDSKWFFDNYEKLKENYKGKYILIKDGKVKLVAEGLEKLKDKAEKLKLDVTTSVVEFIPKKDVVAII